MLPSVTGGGEQVLTLSLLTSDALCIQKMESKRHHGGHSEVIFSFRFNRNTHTVSPVTLDYTRR